MDLEMSLLGDDFFEHLDDATHHEPEPAPPAIQISSHSINIGIGEEVSCSSNLFIYILHMSQM